jgi:hypothetical protein
MVILFIFVIATFRLLSNVMNLLKSRMLLLSRLFVIKRKISPPRPMFLGLLGIGERTKVD